MDKPHRFIHYEKATYKSIDRGYGSLDWKLVKPGQVVIGRLAVSTTLFVWTLVVLHVILAAPIFWVGSSGLVVFLPLIAAIGSLLLWLAFLAVRALVRFIKSNSEWRGPGYGS